MKQKIKSVDDSIAKQLQKSIELNSRTMARIERFIKAFFVNLDGAAGIALQKILKDEDFEQ
jgi:hypothetical protein